ncbi:hypothetical protein KEM52_000972, partial [Ascosphaera acerosa]
VVACHQGQRLTYAELDGRSNALARALQAEGVAKGERVVVALGNRMEHAVVCDLPLPASEARDEVARHRPTGKQSDATVTATYVDANQPSPPTRSTLVCLTATLALGEIGRLRGSGVHARIVAVAPVPDAAEACHFA